MSDHGLNEPWGPIVYLGPYTRDQYSSSPYIVQLRGYKSTFLISNQLSLML